MDRTSIVNNIIVAAVSAASTFIVGDAVRITSSTKALAVQRQVAVFFEAEGEFTDYDIFTAEIPRPVVHSKVCMQVIQDSPFIKVNSIDVIGVSEASALQIGATRNISLEARLKHFRQFVQ